MFSECDYASLPLSRQRTQEKKKVPSLVAEYPAHYTAGQSEKANYTNRARQSNNGKVKKTGRHGHLKPLMLDTEGLRQTGKKQLDHTILVHKVMGHSCD